MTTTKTNLNRHIVNQLVNKFEHQEDQLITRLLKHFTVNMTLNEQEYLNLKGKNCLSFRRAKHSRFSVCASLRSSKTPREYNNWLPSLQNQIGDIVLLDDTDNTLYVRQIWRQYILEAMRLLLHNSI
jgi:hypothetical protein